MRTIYLLCAIGLVLSLTSCQALMQGMAAAMYGYSSGANNASSGYYGTSSAGSSSSYSSHSSSSSSSASTRASSSSSSTSSSSSSKICRLCAGTGKCSTCNGKGTYYPEGYGIRQLKDCPNCSNGKCSSCGGTGRR